MSGFYEYSSSGIRNRILWQDAIGAEAQIVEIDAGSEFKTLSIHIVGPEKVFVVSGVFSVSAHDYSARIVV